MLFFERNLSLIADLIEFFAIIMVFFVPIFLVERYALWGVFMATLIVEINIILTDVLIYKLRGQQLDQENYEFWITIWIPVFFYCIFILLIKCFFKICNTSS